LTLEWANDSADPRKAIPETAITKVRKTALDFLEDKCRVSSSKTK